MVSDDLCMQMTEKPCVNLILGPLGDVVLAVVAGLFIMALYCLYKGYRLLSKGGP